MGKPSRKSIDAAVERIYKTVRERVRQGLSVDTYTIAIPYGGNVSERLAKLAESYASGEFRNGREGWRGMRSRCWSSVLAGSTPIALMRSNDNPRDRKWDTYTGEHRLIVLAEVPIKVLDFDEYRQRRYVQLMEGDEAKAWRREVLLPRKMQELSLEYAGGGGDFARRQWLEHEMVRIDAELEG